MPERREALTRAARIGAAVEIQDVRLLSCMFHLAEVAWDDTPSLHTEWFAEFDPPDEECNLTVRVFFRLALPHDSDENEPFDAFADFQLRYSIDAEKCDLSADDSDKDLHAFADLNGVFNAWPYWRVLVESITSSMNLPKVLVPVFRMPLHDVKRVVRKRPPAVSAETASVRTRAKPKAQTVLKS